MICGRVADASPIIGASAWWHGWGRTDYDLLARSLIAGHLIECSVYVTGGNFTGFKDLDWDQINNIGYPIAEIAADGDIVITKVANTGGLVSKETCKKQLLYEIQGMYYLNCDVTTIIDQACFGNIAPNRVRLSGITGKAPPGYDEVWFDGFWRLSGQASCDRCEIRACCDRVLNEIHPSIIGTNPPHGQLNPYRYLTPKEAHSSKEATSSRLRIVIIRQEKLKQLNWLPDLFAIHIFLTALVAKTPSMAVIVIVRGTVMS